MSDSSQDRERCPDCGESALVPWGCPGAQACTFCDSVFLPQGWKEQEIVLSSFDQISRQARTIARLEAEVERKKGWVPPSNEWDRGRAALAAEMQEQFCGDESYLEALAWVLDQISPHGEDPDAEQEKR